MYKSGTHSKVSTQAPSSKIKQTSSIVQTSDKPIKKIRPFNPLEYLYTGYHPDQIFQFKAAFDNFDIQKTGEANVNEMKEAFVNLGFSQQNSIVMKILNYIDKKNEGVILFKQFIDIATLKLNEDWTREQSNRLFSVYDSSGEGKFSFYDLEDLNEDLGNKYDHEQLKHMFKRADIDDDGFVTQEDFYYIIIGQGKDHERQIIKKKAMESMEALPKQKQIKNEPKKNKR